MTKKELKSIDKIMYALQEAQQEYATLSEFLHDELNDTYDEFYTPSHCILWGLRAIEEVSSEAHNN